jgi:hypothetical protein
MERYGRKQVAGGTGKVRGGFGAGGNADSRAGLRRDYEILRPAFLSAQQWQHTLKARIVDSMSRGTHTIIQLFRVCLSSVGFPALSGFFLHILD